MRIFSKNRKLEPRRRFGGQQFQNKIKEAANYKRMFNPHSGFSLTFMPGSTLPAKATKLAGGVLLLFIIYSLTISPTFLVTDVTVKGNRQVSRQQVEELLTTSGSRFSPIKKNNFFLMSRGRVNNQLTSAIPTIKEVVSYHRSWPNKVSVEIVEHTPGFVIESDGRYFLVNEEGTVVSQVEDSQKLLVAHDQLTENFIRGEILPNQKLAMFIISMNKSWGSKVSVGIEFVKFPGKSSNDVQFVTKAGWEVLFDTARPVSVQLANLAVILSKQISPSQQVNLAYIDLRLSKWVYYCFKESPCQQKEQPQTAGTETNAE